MQEPLPLATIFRSIFEFLSKRTDLVLFGAHAVNAYCEPERMTQDVDLLSTNAEEAAEALRSHLFEAFHVAIRIREVARHDAYRVYQVRDPKNRHLIDLRQVKTLAALSRATGYSGDRARNPCSLQADCAPRARKQAQGRN
jgi:hypothetical protein